jgi:serine protease Do
MRTSKWIGIGLACGVALLVAVGLIFTISASNSSSLNSSMRETAVEDQVITPAEKLGDAFAMVAAHVKPAVVSVFSERSINTQTEDSPNPLDDDLLRRFFGDKVPPNLRQNPQRSNPGIQRGMGSGMIIDTDGHILTNNHVVQDETRLQVQLADKRQFDAEVVSTDPRTDVAIIKLKGDFPSDLPVAQLGDSDKLRPGDIVMAVGAPFGLQQTVTHGIISATGRSDVGIADFEDFLQTDTPINPGNSGGPLVNMRGEVIGMNSAIATRVGQSAGVGFSIPINMVKSMMPTLVKGGKISRGMLGVGIQDLTKALADQFGLSDTKGALVSQVTKGSPAEKAGIQAGDVIVGFNGKDIIDSTRLRNLVAATAPQNQAKVDLIRDGTKQTVNVTLGTLSSETSASAESNNTENGDQLSKLGITAQPLTPELAEQFGIQNRSGVMISDVKPGSPAARANLQAGDVITEVNRKPVSSVDDLRNAMSGAKNSVLLLINRKGSSVFVALPVK